MPGPCTGYCLLDHGFVRSGVLLRRTDAVRGTAIRRAAQQPYPSKEQLDGLVELPSASKLTCTLLPGEMSGGLRKVIVSPLADAFAPDADEKLSPGNTATSVHPLSVVVP